MWWVSQPFSYSMLGPLVLSWLPSLDPILHGAVPSWEAFYYILFCVWEGFGFFHSFLHMPDNPRPPREGPTTKMGCYSLSLPRRVTWTPHPGSNFQKTSGALLTNEDIKKSLQVRWLQQVNPLAWDQGIPGKAKNAMPVTTALKDPHKFPQKTQFPLGPKPAWDFNSSFSKFLSHGLLTPIP